MKHQQASAPVHDAERAAKVIKRAVEIMKVGHYGWSWALAKANAEVDQ